MKRFLRPSAAALMAASLALAAGCSLLGGAAGEPDPPAEEQASEPGAGAGAGTGPGPQDAAPPANAEGPAGFDLVPWAQGFERPVQIVPVPGSDPRRYLVVEQAGALRVVETAPGSGEPAPGDDAAPAGGAGAAGDHTARPVVAERPVLDLRGRIAARGEQGLLSVAFHPRYPEAPWLFASYTNQRGDTRIVRYTVAVDTLQVDEDSAVTLLAVEQPYANHNGGLILFGPDGGLYLGLGDGGSAGDPLGHGQNPDTLLGTLLRLEVDGDGPVQPEIWAYGLRNPWRFSFDRDTGDLYIADVGQNAVEEVNLLPAGTRGLNFGWNAWEGSRRYSDVEPFSDVTFPIAEYSHDGGHCSITGGYVYRGRAIPALYGVYFFSDLCSGTLWGLGQAAGSWHMEILAETDLQPVAFAEDLDGELFLVDHRGTVYRIVPGETPVPAGLR